VGLFGRRKNDAQDAGVSASESSNGPTVEGDNAPELVIETTTSQRSQGPWDLDEHYPDEMRIDLGALRVPQRPDIRIQVQADPTTGVVSQLSLVTNTSAVQLQPYAAPRTGGMWDDIRSQIKSSINKSGGLVEDVEGNFGVELRAQVTGQDGKAQPARFCGVDGPRWFLRMVFLGQAARDATAAAPLEEFIRGIVVVRGADAMPMGNALSLRVPQEQIQGTPGESEVTDAPVSTPNSERPTITLPERGPEITETR